MGYARHIGRVGALAVTLGVGAAIANTPGIAYAETPGTSPNGDSVSKTESSPTTGTTTDGQGASAADANDADSSAADRKAQRRSVLRSVVKSILHAAGNTADTGNAAGAQDSVGGVWADRTESNTSRIAQTTKTRAHATSLADTADDVRSTVTTFTQRVEKAVQKYVPSGPAPTTHSAAAASIDPIKTAATTIAPSAALAAPAPQPRTSVVPLVTNLLGAVLHPLLYPGTGDSPPQLPTLMMVLAAVRDEVERIVVRRPPPPAPRQTSGQPLTYPDPPADPTKQHVLVVAIDGTNMNRVLADPENDNFFELMDTSTSSAPSIVGHTTVSNPSWTAILTGAWDNKTGVINNVFTPWTYDRFPSVFTQLETSNPAIRTKAIADWDVIAAISDSGVGADEVVYIPQVADDPNWAKTDAAVTAEAVKSIKGTEQGYQDVPNYMVAYLVQDDENGHFYGADSIEYKEAVERTDENLGALMDAVAAREAATGEDWTIIVVTDHGHQPQQGFGHGFQSPDETGTFVIVDGPQFADSAWNPDYEIVDVTPTVLDLFGAPQRSYFDGVPLTSLHGRDSDELTQTELQDAIKAQIAYNDFPNIVTNVALSVRTIVAFIPYYVYGAGLPAPLGDIAYVLTNVPAQLVAFGTGVYGARIFQILPPPPIVITPEGPNSIEAAFRTDCGGPSLAAAACIAV